MSNSVFVLDTNKKPLSPCTPGIARSLLKAGKAEVFRQYPFTIILKKAVNQAKSNLDIKDFLAGKPSILKRILAQAKAPLKDAAAVNSTRWKLFNSLKSTGGQTKFNRTQQCLPKTHWLDAACVGNTPKLEILTNQPLLIKCTGHGQRQVIHVDKHGFPRLNKSGHQVRKSALIKAIKGFQTGDIVRAIVTKGKKIGSYLGQVAVRSSGSFNIKTATSTVQGINYKYCSIIQHKDGYLYQAALAATSAS